MKVLSRILVTITAMICVLITGGIIASACYNPLKESELKSLFKSAKMCRKNKSEDLKSQCATSMWKETPVHKEDNSLVYSIVEANVVGATSKLQKEIAALCGSLQIRNLTGFVYWDNLSSEKKEDVADKIKRSKSIVASYVQNTFTVGDNNLTDSLLSALSNMPSNREVKSFYFHLFNDIAIKSDGALAEMVSEYIKPMLLSDVDYVLTYIMNHKEYYTLYTSMLAENLYLKGDDYYDSIRLFNQFRLEFTTKPITDRKSGNTFCESVRSRITELWNE